MMHRMRRRVERMAKVHIRRKTMKNKPGGENPACSEGRPRSIAQEHEASVLNIHQTYGLELLFWWMAKWHRPNNPALSI